jgi:hypothetical protein
MNDRYQDQSFPALGAVQPYIEAFEAELQREGWVKARAKQKVKDAEEAPIQEKRGLARLMLSRHSIPNSLLVICTANVRF